MLKINLLPVRQLKKRAKAQKQLFGMLLMFLLLVGASVLVGVLQVQAINGLKADISSLEQQKAQHKSTLDKIDKMKKDIAEFERKTEIIGKLKTDSSLTVRVLDEIANTVDNQRMWLESVNQDNASLQLSGVALDNQTVAQFMDTLKASPFVQDVNLTNSSLKVVSGRNLKSFELVCVVAAPAPDAAVPLEKPQQN